MTAVGTPYFVNFTKACDYYKGQGLDDVSPALLESILREKIAEGDIFLGKPELEPGERLLLIDNGTRYGIERS